MKLADFLQFHSKGSKVAFVEQTPYRTRQYTYREIDQGMRRAAASFRRMSIAPGDRVILHGESSARWVSAFYACVLSGVVVVPIDASFSEAFVQRILMATQAKLLCSDLNSGSWEKLVDGPDEPLVPIDAAPGDLLEIIYTSGTTAEPKGVMITHGNLLSNLVPVYHEIQKYKRYAVPFSPLGFVHLIPLSHLFGQIMGLFIPQILDGKVIFSDPAAPHVVRAVKRNRASVIICVPQQMGMLHKHVEKTYSIRQREVRVKGVKAVLVRWWHYRHIHRIFGWKFWSFISGGASLPVSEEQFWRMLGYLIIQGYGLTETAPSITITHPLKIVQGAVGQKLPGIEVKIADDGELLVRGPNVTPGYYGDEKSTNEAFSDGWLRTGDLGRFDEQGNLVLLGRKKEVIVTSEGLNVYPQDVEDILNKDPRVRESAVVAQEQNGRTVVRAVLVLQERISSDALPEIISQTNQKLESYQQIRSSSLWPDAELPRTSTGKLRRLAVASGSPATTGAPRTTEEIVSKLLARSGQAVEGIGLEEDLGLSSLERVELMVQLEQSTGAPIDEVRFAQAKTVGEIAELMRTTSSSAEATKYPSWKWPSNRVVRLFRQVVLYGLVFPALRIRVRVQTEGLHNLPPHYLPLLFVSNHQSILDVPVILKALPSKYRRRLAPAMGTGRKPVEMAAAGLFFHAYPLPGSSVGLRDAIQHTGDLIDRGFSPLVFPEGARTKDGRMQPFRPGIGVIARHVSIAVVPIHITGAFEIWPIHAEGPGKGTVTVRFDAPIDFTGKDASTITRELESLYSPQRHEGHKED